ncbi:MULTISPECIES: hypothetical protein [Proteiniphilum]|jgi:DNA-directed RNA polymerase specialized sigma24 family protein|uniref:hypothetical protein n=3 Tax=Bacteria TaxID=2 RepID=UPI001EEC624C|nr:MULTISPECIES: hypothetical protein [Proteiniphilum]ULB34924.1 sigma-70 family RNA polymerase sigma factor [Proteiniphilum propionicum]
MSKNAIAIGIYDNMDAEDIVQDVLADIWVNKQVLLDNKITHKESLNAFLIEKITGKIANLNKKHDRNISLDVPIANEKDILNNYIFDEEIEKIEWNEFSEILNTIIKELPTPLRFTSYLLLKKQYGEYDTARVMGVSTHQVKLYFDVAKKRINENLKKYYSFDFNIGKHDLKNSI